MQVYELDFGKIIAIDKHLAEVIINDGVEMDDEIVDQYHDFLVSHFTAPFSLLINKINSYTYTFSAQRSLATIPQIHAMAVIAYSDVSHTATEALIEAPRAKQWNIEIFPDRNSALSWLEANTH